jgi:hypothetical protein
VTKPRSFFAIAFYTRRRGMTHVEFLTPRYQQGVEREAWHFRDARAAWRVIVKRDNLRQSASVIHVRYERCAVLRRLHTPTWVIAR